jgi:thioredoxin-dependent peroxiredoxin
MMENQNTLNIGDIAADFKVKNQEGLDISLYKVLASGQKVLLIFYPGDDTPGCTKQLCGVRDIYNQYSKKNVTVFGINHASADSHEKFIQKYNFPFDILVDTDKKIIKQFGAEKFFFKNLIIKRGVFLIGTDKKIIYKHWGQQDNQKVLDILDKTM